MFNKSLVNMKFLESMKRLQADSTKYAYGINLSFLVFQFCIHTFKLEQIITLTHGYPYKYIPPTQLNSVRSVFVLIDLKC